MMQIVYMTNRMNPEIGWFFDSLENECQGDYSKFKLWIMDFYADYDGRRDSFEDLAHCKFEHLIPKPSVWQGQWRLTKEDYYAGASAHNTAACLVDPGYIMFVSDLSVLIPGWLDAALESCESDRIVCGSYCKANDMSVENGKLINYTSRLPGRDHRREKRYMPTLCGGGWLFGCCFGMPLPVFLSVNGMDEATDGMGYEDVYFGRRLERAGYPIYFDPRLMIFESDEKHHPPYNVSMRRENREINGRGLDWLMVDYVSEHDQALGTESLIETRASVRNLNDFSLPDGPFLWSDGLPTHPEAFK